MSKDPIRKFEILVWVLKYTAVTIIGLCFVVQFFGPELDLLAENRESTSHSFQCRFWWSLGQPIAESNTRRLKGATPKQWSKFGNGTPPSLLHHPHLLQLPLHRPSRNPEQFRGFGAVIAGAVESEADEAFLHPGEVEVLGLG